MTTAVQLFGPIDTFKLTMGFIPPRDTYNVSRVCRSWQKGLEEILEHLHRAASLPEMEAGEYTCRSYVFLNETMGGVLARFEKYIGKTVEPLRVFKWQIKALSQRDHDDPAKWKFETYEGVPKPRAIKRATPDGKEIEIPLSVAKAIALLENPLAGKENCPVFKSLPSQVYEQCTASVVESSIGFIRREVPEESRKWNWDQQKDRLPDARVANLLELILLYGIQSLEPETHTQSLAKNLACTPDTIQYDIPGEWQDHLIIGHYIPRKGLCIYIKHPQAGAVPALLEKKLDTISAVPDVPEVRPLVLGSLALDEGADVDSARSDGKEDGPTLFFEVPNGNAPPSYFALPHIFVDAQHNIDEGTDGYHYGVREEDDADPSSTGTDEDRYGVRKKLDAILNGDDPEVAKAFAELPLQLTEEGGSAFSIFPIRDQVRIAEPHDDFDPMDTDSEEDVPELRYALNDAQNARHNND